MTELEVLARADSDRVERAVRNRLHRYLTYCLRYSPYWQERWPSAWRTFREEEVHAVLAELPPLRKEDLRLHHEALRIPPSARRSNDGFPASPGQHENFSGGSTGVPTRVWQDARFTARNRAVMDHAYRSLGVSPGRPTFFVWGSNNELVAMGATLRKRVSTWARGLIPMPSFSLGPEKVREYAASIDAQVSVDQAICFVSALDTVTRIAEREQIPLRRIRRIVTGGGKLHDEVRQRARRVWADDVFEIYGTRDIGLVGVEAPDHDGIVTFPWHNYVEVLDEGRPVGDGETGEVHVTCLQNHAFALIRMSLGDVARHRDRRPGWNRARIADVLGRSAEHLTASDGRRVDPASVIHLLGVLEARPWVRRFQLQQRSPSVSDLRIEVWNHPGAEALEAYRAHLNGVLARVLGDDLALRVEVVDEIPAAPSGKHFYCIGLSESIQP